MTNRTCLTCVFWKRHLDQHIGTCAATNAPEKQSYRVQHEDCTEGRYQFGEDRPKRRMVIERAKLPAKLELDRAPQIGLF